MGVTATSRRDFVRSAVLCVSGCASIRASRLFAAAAPRVVVVGGGFAGATCALQLRRANSSIEVLLVDPDDRYIACPMSNSVLTGLRDFAYITVSRSGLAAAGVKHVKDRIIAIDGPARRARLGSGVTLAYDRLVVAPGIRLLWGRPEGYDEAAAERMPHAWIAGAQTKLLAAQLRGLHDGGVIAITVPVGPMRCPPGPFERATLMAAYLQRHKRRCKILIFDSNNHFPRQETFTEVWHSLYPGMIEWIPVTDGGAVLRVDPAAMVIQTSSGAHRADIVNVIPQQAPAELALQAGLASDHGWCPVDPLTFESRLLPQVYVIGDACIADPMPKAGSSAHAQGRHCALTIAAAFDGKARDPVTLESVCYSLLSRDRALSIHARFRVVADAIQQLPADEEATPVSAGQEARNAADWYRRLLTDSFG